MVRFSIICNFSILDQHNYQNQQINIGSLFYLWLLGFSGAFYCNIALQKLRHKVIQNDNGLLEKAGSQNNIKQEHIELHTLHMNYISGIPSGFKKTSFSPLFM